MSFDLVIPSMPGYGFSQKIVQPGCNVSFIADLWHKLMLELGYEKYGVQGGDFGAGVSTALSMKYPGNVTGMHLNYIPGNYVPVLEENEEFLLTRIPISIWKRNGIREKVVIRWNRTPNRSLLLTG